MSATIGFLQFEPRFGAVRDNIAAAASLLSGDLEADLLVLPELAFTGYDFLDVNEARNYAEIQGEGPTSQAARDWARKWNMIVVAGYAERTDDGLYNSAILVKPDGSLTNYRKLHLFSRETELFLPGDSTAPVVHTAIGRIGLMICFDWFYPETARSLALRGADIIAHPSNLVLPYCQRAMYARSVENHVFTVTANRIGTESRAGRSLTFTGASQVVSPGGDYLVQAPLDKPRLGLTRVEVGEAANKRINPYNDLFAQRRPEFYAGL